MERDLYIVSAGLEHAATQAGWGSEGDGVEQPVEATPAPGELFRRLAQLSWISDVDGQHIGLG